MFNSLKMMPCRRDMLVHSFENLDSGLPPFVGKYEDSYVPLCVTDDYGMYYFIPKLAQILGIHVETASYLFLFGLTFISSLFALLAFWKAYPSKSQRLISLTGFFFLIFFTSYNDLYVAPSACASLLLPFLLLKLPQQNVFFAIFSLFGLGIFLGYANTIRIHSGTGGLLLLFLFLLIKNSIRAPKKLTFFIVCLIGFSLPAIHFNYLKDQQKQFLTAKGYSMDNINTFHPLWHSIYIGFSFVKNNPYNIEYSDTCAYEKVVSIQPKAKYLSDEYEQILKNECLKLLINDPFFVIKTCVYKMLKFSLIFLILGGSGLVLHLFYGHLRKEDLFLFAAAMMYYASPGILVIPGQNYILGFISTCIIFGIYSFNEALAQGKILLPLKRNLNLS